MEHFQLNTPIPNHDLHLRPVVNLNPPETIAKTHAHVSSLLCLLTTLELLHVPFSHGMVHPLLLGIISNKLSFQWQSSSDLWS